jgi:hypothetical protein
MISIIHPSRSRPEMAFKTIQKWISSADNAVEYILSIDNDDFSYDLNVLGGLPIQVLRRVNSNAVQAINRAAAVCTGDILIVVSDDTDTFEHWDTLLLKELEGKSDFCAKTDDGLQPTLITMPIMDRVYYERYGYVYEKSYVHLHCDEELTCVALMTGKYIKLDLKFPHDHYTTGRTLMDGLNARNNATWKQGQATLDAHAKNNFGIENPVMRREDIKWR